ncbi:MAG: MFS transporter [Candidatus Andeanibacterium colombiense]|uniref:MFS transporter n=1 Tax=Candidatus Andeanibacterium colombiense TaxID=3121345 RepID=A0AAJ5X5M0_9SPHN|nr:MAG: MFS transporter [Sphingomonadaceae bacterium]
MLLAACLLCAVIDGYDVAIISYVTPDIAREWSVPLSTFGWVFSAGLIGLVLGALVLAPAADRYGRRAIMLVAVSGATVATMANALAADLTHLVLSRICVGLTVGAMTALVVAVAFEVAPRRVRVLMVTVVGCGFSLGNLLCGVLASAVIPAWGWRVLFYGGAAALLVVGILFFFFLGNAAKTADRNGGGYIAGIKALVRPGQRGLTASVWLLHFGGVGTLYMIMSWMPSLLTRSGYSTAQAAFAVAFISAGGLFGGVIGGLLLNAIGKTWLLVNYAIAGATMAALPLFFDSWLIFPINVIVGFCVVGGYICNNVVAADVYPSGLRASGVGWAQGVGRTSSVASPLLVSLALQLNATNTQILLVGSAFPAMSACAAFLLIRARSLQPAIGKV